MTLFDFTGKAHGKWILAGEHAVIRGRPALVFPLHSHTMSLHYQAHTRDLKVNFSGKNRETLTKIFLDTLHHGLKLANRPTTKLTGTFSLENNIPTGRGMGGSAALCVNLARWFVYKDFISSPELFDFARKLEDLFHGLSSGIDLVSAISDTGNYFQNATYRPIDITWQPQWYLSFSGTISSTAKCVAKVQQLWQQDPTRAREIDDKMHHAVTQAVAALQDSSTVGLELLSLATNQAQECFANWGLLTEPLQRQIDKLLNAGAIGTKPTGSGGGGYVLSLWQTPPPIALADELFKLTTTTTATSAD